MNTGFDIKRIIEVLKGVSCPPLELSVVERIPLVHDFSKPYWGHKCEITRIDINGQKLHLAVWTQDRLEVGDYLILGNGEDTTRYKIEALDRQHDPADMHFVKAVFAPREALAG